MMQILFTIMLNLFLSLHEHVYEPGLLLLMVWIMILSLYMKVIRYITYTTSDH